MLTMITERQQEEETRCPGATAYLLIDGEIPINLLHLLTKHIDNSLKCLWLTSRLEFLGLVRKIKPQMAATSPATELE